MIQRDMTDDSAQSQGILPVFGVVAAMMLSAEFDDCRSNRKLFLTPRSEANIFRVSQ